MTENGCFREVVHGLCMLHRCNGGSEPSLLKPGDLIEYIRGPFSHWAIYLGHRKVAHLPGPSNIFANFQICQQLWRMLSGNWIEPMHIEIRDFNELLFDSLAYINNSKDNILHASSTDEILQRVHDAIGSVGYDLLLYNCEHFAHWCRYGIAVSDQVVSFLTLISSLGMMMSLASSPHSATKCQLLMAACILLGISLFASAIYQK